MTIGEALVNRYTKMGSNLMTHHKLLAAKGAVIQSSMPHTIKSKMVNGYRSAEKSMFGRTTTLPGESELGVSGMGTTMGQRAAIKREGLSEAGQSSSPSDTGQSDLYQSLISRFSGEQPQ